MVRFRSFPAFLLGLFVVSGCGGGGSLRSVPYPFASDPADQTPWNGLAAGSSVDDLFIAAVAIEGDAIRSHLWHYDGHTWEDKGWPDALAEDNTLSGPVSMVSAGDGELWMTESYANTVNALVRVDATGTVVDDRLADIAPTEAFNVALYSGGGGVFLKATGNSGVTWYRLDGDAFVPLGWDSAVVAGVYAIVGPDEAYVGATIDEVIGVAHYEGGALTALPIGSVEALHGYASSPSDVWFVLDAASLMHGDGTNWNTVAVVDYDFEEQGASLETRTPWIYAAHGDDQLSVLSTYRRGGTSGLDWADVAVVDGDIGDDGHYVGERIARDLGKCDPTCDSLALWPSGPIRLADGTVLVMTSTYGADADREFLAWTP